MTRRAEIERLARFMGGVRVGFRINDKRWVVTAPGDKGESRLFDPFTRLDDAMAVAGKVMAHGNGFSFGFRLETHCENSEEKWNAFFPSITSAPPYEEMNPVANFGEGNSAAEAITLAALAYLSATEGK